MRRRGEQILAESVEDHKLAREELGHLEALAHEHVLADHAEVRGRTWTPGGRAP